MVPGCFSVKRKEKDVGAKAGNDCRIPVQKMVYWICNIFYFGSKWRDLLKNSTELCNIVYNILLSKIQFGVYGFGEKLPTMEEASACLHVSVDTTRAFPGKGACFHPRKSLQSREVFR